MAAGRVGSMEERKYAAGADASAEKGQGRHGLSAAKKQHAGEEQEVEVF